MFDSSKLKEEKAVTITANLEVELEHLKLDTSKQRSRRLPLGKRLKSYNLSQA
jgi:hypothetical protein